MIVPQEESSEISISQPAVVTATAFEELRQQVVTITQLLSQRNSHSSPTPTPQEGFMADARAGAQRPITNVVQVGTSSVPYIASTSRSLTMEFGKLAKIIQEGITAGLLQNTRGQ